SSREAADRAWAAFSADSEAQDIGRRTNANGRIVASVERMFATPADFSPVPTAPQAALTIVPCDSAEARGSPDAIAVCRTNARWDEANLKMDATIVEPILDDAFVWPDGNRLRPRSDIIDILRTTTVRFRVYESHDVVVFLTPGMAQAIGVSRRQVTTAQTTN